MRIAVYGGSFNPPHIGHVNVVNAVGRERDLQCFYIIPAGQPPHKAMATDSASASERMEMARLAFGEGMNILVSDMEIRREGKSYTVDTMKALQAEHPDGEFSLVVGTDMFLSLDGWREAEFLLDNERIEILVVPRDSEREAIEARKQQYAERFGSRIRILDTEPLPAASTDVRSLLKERKGRELLPDAVYAYVIQKRLYGARPDFVWLREQAYAMLKPKRIPHVRGCEEEAVRLAERWGGDREMAAEAAILHDITKKLMLPEQLLLCDKYGIITDTLESGSEKLLHARTGAALARERFGVCGPVEDAIRWHTTGRAGMSLLEKIIYMADYIEPSRDFEGVDELRALAYEDLDRAMILGLEMSCEDIVSRGYPAHENSIRALEWFRSLV